MSRVSHRNDVFFQSIIAMGEALPQAAQQFLEIIEGWPATKELVPKMSEWERHCDGITAHVIVELNKSFITPFDREDINHLIRSLDEVVDLMEDCAVRFDAYKVCTMIPEASLMAQLILEACQALHVLTEHLPQFKKDPMVMQQVMQVSQLEDKGDVVHRNAISSIFDKPDDPIHTIKWKSLIDSMEATLDTCKLVGNVVQSVVMKNA